MERCTIRENPTRKNIPKKLMDLMQKLWTKEDQILLDRTKENIVAGATLEIQDPSCKLYTKSDWSKDGM